MNTINQTEAGCYLLNINAFGVQTKDTFNKKVLQGNAIKIDGIYTYPDTTFKLNWKKEKVYTARRKGTDYYDYRNITILIDGVMHQGSFRDLYDSRTRFYINSDGNQSIINMQEI